MTKSGAHQGAWISRATSTAGPSARYGVASTFYTGARCRRSPTSVENYHFRGARYFTNKAPCGPKRGHGTVQPRFALEVPARQGRNCDLDLDPAELRLRQPRASVIRSPPTSCASVRWASGSASRRLSRDRGGRSAAASCEVTEDGRVRGLGIACSSYLSGAGLPIYWNSMPHSGRAAETRPQWTGHRVLWQRRNRAG